MTDELTGTMRAAALHGVATNRAYELPSRLAAALEALDIYEREVEKLRTDTDGPSAPAVTPLVAADLLADPTRHGFVVFYGVPVCAIGEDGDLVALGHHEPRRVIAAMNAYSRRLIGLGNLYDDEGATYVAAAVRLSARHTILLGVDACEYRADDAEQGKAHRCDMCSTIESQGWWMRTSDEPVPGSFPTMVWSA